LANIKRDQERWTIIWPLLKAEFTVESDDKLVLDGLAYLAMKHTENAKKSYMLIPEGPALDNGSKVDIAEVREYYQIKDW
jgi:hypothetical protein